MSSRLRSFLLLFVLPLTAAACFGDDDADVRELEDLPPGQETDTIAAPVVPPAPSTPQ